MRRPRILLADDHTLLLDAFTKLLESECDVVGKATDGRQLLDLAKELRPDVVVLDIGMPLLNGLDAGRQLRTMLPNTRIIYVTCNEDPDLAAKAFQLGASGFLLKSCAASELFQAIKEALQNRVYVTPRSTAGMVKSLTKTSQAGNASLTARQREVLQLLAEGRPMKEVATILNVTPRTVAFHKYRMMEELGLKSNAELVQYAIRNHIISM